MLFSSDLEHVAEILKAVEDELAKGLGHGPE